MQRKDTNKTQSPEAKETPLVTNSVWWHNYVSSAAGGATGGYVCFPFEGLKKRMQTKQPISFHPKELYRGSSAFAVSVMLASFSQMAFYDQFKKLPGYDADSVAWNSGLAVMSGMLGAVVGSAPVENDILTQQLNKTNPFTAFRIMFKEGYTRPWTGLAPLMYRESGFGLTMLYGAEKAYNVVYNATGSAPLSVAAQMSAGIVGAILSQPGDTLATRMQRHGESLPQAVKSIRNEGLKEVAKSEETAAESGMLSSAWKKVKANKAFFKGGSQRVFLFTGCAMIIPPATRAVKKMLSGHDETQDEGKNINLKH